VYQLWACRDVLITQCRAGILTNVRKTAEMSHCLEPKENTRPPYRVQRNNCHKPLMEDLISVCTELIAHVESVGRHTKHPPQLNRIRTF
jgi:hypothetical protein